LFCVGVTVLGDEAMRAFWEWFSSAREDVANAQPWAVDELKRRLSDMGVPHWEAGPLDPQGELSFLALSPASVGDIERLRAIAAGAPDMPGWRVMVGKPKKHWNRVFRWSSAGATVDASQWRCVVFRYADGQHEIVVLDPAIPEALADKTQAIIEFVVRSELGEIKTLEKVCGIFAEPPSDTASLEASIPIADLDAAIA
jgi:hypothetical protein